MELSNLKVEKKNQLYFKKYSYKARVKIVGACYTYYTNDIETYTNRIQKWKDESKKSNTYGYRVLTTEYWDLISIPEIERFLLWRSLHSQKDCITRIQGDYVSIFCNDLDILESVKSIGSDVQYYKIELTTEGTLLRKSKSPYSYRTFFKGKRVSKDFVENFNEFAKIYKSDVVSISPAMVRFMQRQWTPYMYTHNSYFIDYKDESFITILYMYFPNMISKTYKIEEEPKN